MGLLESLHPTNWKIHMGLKSLNATVLKAYMSIYFFLWQDTSAANTGFKTYTISKLNSLFSHVVYDFKVLIEQQSSRLWSTLSGLWMALEHPRLPGYDETIKRCTVHNIRRLLTLPLLKQMRLACVCTTLWPSAGHIASLPNNDFINTMGLRALALNIHITCPY